MVKLDYERDYYADLDLPHTADAADVKKQFKKLALRWHPDRNPGREDAAKEQFLIIQAAHEILADPVTKNKFDAYRQRNSRYPGASGVRGNPWQHTAQEVNQKFGAPPRRPPVPTRQQQPAATAASTKYWDWAKTKAKPESARANMDAWDRSRPQQARTSQSAAGAGAGAGGAARSSRPREPPVPRTAAQARRQEAAFGTRKSGFAPASSVVGDEPPVRSQNYNTSAYATQGGPAAPAAPPRPPPSFVDPLSAQFSETFLDNRQRTPYAANVGEKTNPFEPLNVNRARSMRDGSRRGDQDGADESPPTPPPRQRSASVGSDKFKRSANGKSSFSESGPDPSFQFQSRASARYSPRGPDTNSAPATATFPGSAGPGASANGGVNATANGDAFEQAKNGTKVYEPPFYKNPNTSPASSTTSNTATLPPRSGVCAGVGLTPGKKFDFRAYKCAESASSTPSGATSGRRADPFEEKVHAQLQHLLAKKAGWPSPSSSIVLPKKEVCPGIQHANGTHHVSFSVPVDHDPTSPAQQTRFTRNSADNINTRFVAEEKGNANFQFSAGAAAATDDGFLRAKQRARAHQSPLRNEFTPAAESSNGTQQPETGEKQGDFVPEEWKDAFGRHIFEPPQPNKPTGSPTRPIRPIKKSRPVLKTAGTAGLVDEEETSGEEKGRASVPPSSGINGSRSPNAMDIDTPPPEPAAGAQPANEPRNIPVEPTNPEWRAGDANTGTAPAAEPRLGAGLQMPTSTAVPVPTSKPSALGSEDSEDFFRPGVFAEFRTVEPFAPPKPTGLGSFADLNSTLPFTSRASAKPPLAAAAAPERPPKQLDIPSPPAAPRAPAGLCVPGPIKSSAPAWTTYVREFEAYLAAWLEFNRRVTDHFAARQKVHERSGTAWVDALGDGGVSQYLRALEEDKFVRQRWMAACEAHELHFREFVGLRERVLGGLN